MSPLEIGGLGIAALFALMLLQIPIGFAMIIVGVVGFALQGGWGPALTLLVNEPTGVLSSADLATVPLFLLMGTFASVAGFSTDIYNAATAFLGHRRGGLGYATIGGSAAFGVVCGSSTATAATFARAALPEMLKRGYSRSLACGTIAASGTLGQVIPPSLVLILLSDVIGMSVGTMFAAAMIPGLMLAGIYVMAMMAVAAVRPDLAPAISAVERAGMSRRQLARKLAVVVAPPLGLVIAVLGSIIGGVAAPTEAASMGAIGALLIVLVSRRFTWRLLDEVARGTLLISAMVFFILIAAQVFGLAFRGLGGEHLVFRMFDLVPGGVTAALIFLMVLIFVLGFFLEWIEITYIAVPLFLPFFIQANVDLVWLGVLICLNLQTSFLTPPFGWSLFFLKGVAPPGVTTGHIYAGVLPFIGLQILALAILFLYPGLATWLPTAIGW